MSFRRALSLFSAWRRIHAVARCIDIVGYLWLHGRGKIVVGPRTRFDGGPSGIELFAMDDARIVIGARCRIDEGVSIEANRSVEVGDDVHLGRFAKILDNDFHRLRGDRHERPEAAAVVIRDRAEIGERAIVLAGVIIGEGAMVRPGAVVTRSVPAGAEVAGNPARRVRR